jgi:transposase
MEIVGGLDLHRAQVTFDVVDLRSGEVSRGQIRPVERSALREWLAQFDGRAAAFALEATTGWWFVVDEIRRAGLEAHLAEPADTAAAKSRKKRAKTDRSDARHLRELLYQGRLPESWIPPEHIVELRTLVRLRKALVDQRRDWQLRIRALLFHHGLPRLGHELRSQPGRAWLAEVKLPPAATQLLRTALGEIDRTDAELAPLDRWLASYARHQPGAQALTANHYGIGPLIATALVAELGDVARFPNGDAVVRHTGLDVTVYSSDTKRSPGRLSRQGPAVLRWALYEAAKCASRPRSPDHDYYQHVRARRDAKRATLAVARKLARRARHTLLALGDLALAPPDDLPALPAAA